MKAAAFALALAMFPLAAAAGASHLEAPATVKFKWGITNMQRISAFSVRGRVSVTSNTCYSTPAADKDVLRESHFSASDVRDGGGVAIDVYAKNLGACRISFIDKIGDTATTTVIVEK